MGATVSGLALRIARVEAAAALYLDALASGAPAPLTPTAIEWLDEVSWE